MSSMYLLYVSFVIVALSTLVISVARKDPASARETGIITIPDKPQVEVPEITAGPEKNQPWREWLQAELATKGDPDTTRPWLNWKPNMEDPSDKPWLYWNQRKMRNGGAGAYEDATGPTTEMMGTYPVVNHARV
ncbi:hypothetical protein BGZ63DRAFT_494438 [Mariannaea sp. PMI_226]|nr:hypothetical protein BGZ63DRAFT_494438 [Mariannaea sp. PMI_226]